MRARGTFCLAVVALLFASVSGFEADDDEDNWEKRQDQQVSVVDLEHSLSGSSFVPRAKVTYTGPKLVTTKSRRMVSVHFEQSKLSSDEVKQLQALADAGKNYKIRIQSDVNDPSSPKVMASVPACLLIASDFHEIIRVHVDQYGHIRGLWYQTMETKCPPGGVKASMESTMLITSVSVDMETKGPKLAMEPIAKAEKEAEEKQKEQPSFFKKYWMWILGGLVLFMMMTPEDPKEGGQQGGGRAPAARR